MQKKVLKMLARGEELHPEDARLLQCASDYFAENGITDTTMDCLAKAAGVTRITYNRRIGGRDDVITSVYLYEAQLLAQYTNDRFGDYTAINFDPVVHVEDLLTFILTDLRSNKLLQGLLTHDRELTIRDIIDNAPAVMVVVTEMLASFIRNTWDNDIHGLQYAARERETHSREVASLIVRFLSSMLLINEGPPHLETEDEMRKYARATLVPLILKRTA